MGWFDEFKARMNTNGKSLSEELVNNTQYLLDETFKDSPTFKLIKHNGLDIPSRVINASSKNGWSKLNNDYRKVIFQNLRYVCNIGEQVQFDDNDWIIIDRENINGSSITVELCNNVLTLSPTLSLPCIISNLTLYSDGLTEGKYMALPDGKRSIVVSNTTDTSKLKLGHRFIFNHDEYSIFSISHKDDFSMPGLIILTMKQEQKRVNDDLVNNIADNEVIETPQTPTGQLIIDGSDSIIINRTQEYVVKMDDGTTHIAAYTFDIDNNSIATITSVTDMTCVVKGLSRGNVVMTAVDLSNGNTITKAITVKSLL